MGKESLYSGLQFDEVKRLICRFSSFSGGQQIIMQSGPMNNRLQLQRQLDRLKQAIPMAVSYGPMPFSGIHDISNEVMLAQKGATLQPAELLKIAEQSYGIEKILQYIKTCELPKNEIEDIANALSSCRKTSEEILRCVSYDETIYDNASAKLATIRRNIKSLQAQISRKMAEFINRNSRYLQEDIQTTRNDRNVVLVKNSFKSNVDGLQYGSSGSGQAVYVEPSEMIPLNNELQQNRYDETQEINRILLRLSTLVQMDSEVLLANTETLAVLDSLFAMAGWAKENDGTVASISKENLIIEKARHPLIDSSKVVANSYHMIKPVKTILITGPNTGGKTVSLKIFGLFAVMFLSGMPLLCESAEIPMFDRVYFDIGDLQSIDDDLSTFSGHVQKIARICEKATSNSLVVLDEIGGATDPAEGQALASAILDYLRNNEIYVVATTHYSKLKAYAKQYDDIMIASMEFDHQKLVPTYRYIENTIGQSYAIDIAARYGINQQIIQNAVQFKKEQQSDSDALMERLQSELESVRQQAEVISLQKEQLQLQLSEVESEKRKLKETSQQLIEQAREEAESIVNDAIEKSEGIIEELKSQKDYDINRVAQLKRELENVVETEQEDEVLEGELRIGDYVRISNTSQKGVILEIDRKNGIVDCDGLKIQAKLKNLVKIAPPAEKKPVKGSSKVVRKTNFSIELNLLGYRVEEALEILDKYLDDAILANVPYVRIIHGVGTGALRSAIWNNLKKYKFIKKYEYASNAEGSTGATIVTFKD